MFSEYSEYFEAIYADGKIDIDIKNKTLPESITNEGGIIVLTLEGYKNLDLWDWSTLIVNVEKSKFKY